MPQQLGYPELAGSDLTAFEHLKGLVGGGELGTASVMYRPIADVGQARGLTRFLTVARATAAASVHA